MCFNNYIKIILPGPYKYHEVVKHLGGGKIVCHEKKKNDEMTIFFFDGENKQCNQKISCVRRN